MNDKTIRRTVRFRDRNIECFKSDYSCEDNKGNKKLRKEKIIPFEVDKNTVLKELKLIEYQNTRAKYILLHYWFNGRSKSLRIGQFIPGKFGTKQVEEKLFKLAKSHQDDKGPGRNNYPATK